MERWCATSSWRGYSGELLRGKQVAGEKERSLFHIILMSLCLCPPPTVCVWARMHTCMHMHACVYVKAYIDLNLNDLLGDSLSLNLELTNLAGVISQPPLRTPIFTSTVLGDRYLHCAWLFMWVLRIWTQGLMFAWQELYWMSNSSVWALNF